MVDKSYSGANRAAAEKRLAGLEAALAIEAYRAGRDPAMEAVERLLKK